MANATFILKSALLILVFAGIVFAGDCSINAYKASCSQCKFDSTGKIDQDCYKTQQAAGTACLTTSNPLLAKAYAEGKCPQVDTCISELNSCKAQYSTANDSFDCKEGSVSTCFTGADQCVVSAAAKCAPPPECKAPTGLILLVIGTVFLSAFVRKS